MAKQICSSCGKTDFPVPETKGSCLVELILWFFFLVPGLIYSVWRRTKVPMVCAHCRQASMIPLDSPRAKQMIAERPELASKQFGDEILLDAETKRCPTCAETIKLEALKCRFCGEEFDSNEVTEQAGARKAEIAERLAKEREGKKQCPQCGSWDVRWATIEDGGMGHWCDNCKHSLKSMGVT